VRACVRACVRVHASMWVCYLFAARRGLCDSPCAHARRLLQLTAQSAHCVLQAVELRSHHHPHFSSFMSSVCFVHLSMIKTRAATCMSSTTRQLWHSDQTCCMHSGQECVCIRIYVCVDLCMYLRMCINMSVCIHICVYVYIYVCMYTYTCIYMYIYIYIYICIYIQRVRERERVCVCVSKCVCVCERERERERERA
jgi:hypothetical protein